MCSEILCYLSKDACGVGSLRDTEIPRAQSPECPLWNLLIKLDKTKHICIYLATVTSFLQPHWKSFLLGWDWSRSSRYFPQLAELFQPCQGRGVCEKRAK